MILLGFLLFEFGVGGGHVPTCGLLLYTDPVREP